MTSIAVLIAQELQVRTQQVEATIELIDGGATIPFIARYRKELTGALDDTQLRKLEERLRYLRELAERRKVILESIKEQNQLSEPLERQIQNAMTKSELEDLYLPYRPKRRTKGQIAIEAGLEPLALTLYQKPELDPEQQALAYVNIETGVPDTKSALEGAKYILMERFSIDAKLLGQLKNFLWEHGDLQSKVIESEQSKGEKFRDYFEFSEALRKVPSHRALALFRGRNEGVLSIAIVIRQEDAENRPVMHPCESQIAAHFGIKNLGRAGDPWLTEVVRWTWRIKLYPHIETDLLGKLKETAELGAIGVFSDNLKDLLLAAPAGAKATLGLDPGLRTGVKVAVVDDTGRQVDHTTIYPHAPKNLWDEAIEALAKLCRQHQVKLISIGNGTASRETEKLAAELMTRYPALKLTRVMVSEAGASVYSASELAAKEFPELDVTIRGAVSIARRLQDPLAELVKIDPKAIGVGQYQHDVSQVQLNRSLNAVVEDCVNAVGVDVNTASIPLLARVSGLNQSIAHNIVEFRDQHGRFTNRNMLKNVPRLGAKAFEQCAGFLRIQGGDNPLDASAVHPESYPVVNHIAQKSNMTLAQLIGNAALMKQLSANDFVTDQVGLITVKDILSELSKPGRDPRPEFKFAEFREGVEKISDLTPGMILEGAVTNVTHFGAFVDIGVHQDGLVHISALSDKFVKDPREVVKTGDIVKVKVIEVDPARKRIALSMKMTDPIAPAEMTDIPTKRAVKTAAPAAAKSAVTGAMANAFNKAKTH